jgi:hypothetical protein
MRCLKLQQSHDGDRRSFLPSGQASPDKPALSPAKPKASIEGWPSTPPTSIMGPSKRRKERPPRMTRLRIGGFLDPVEPGAEDAPWVHRLTHFMNAVTEDHILQASIAVAAASLWLTVAFGDARFLVLLPAAVVAVRRFRRLEREFVPDDDEDDWI